MLFTSSPANSAWEDEYLFLAKTQSPQRKVKGEKPPIQKPCAHPEAYQVEVSGEAQSSQSKVKREKLPILKPCGQPGVAAGFVRGENRGAILRSEGDQSSRVLWGQAKTWRAVVIV
jgi:hypothetical protein